MGLGDWLMATAEAKHYHDIHGLPVVFANKQTHKVYWSEVFENNPKIIRHPKPNQKLVVVENYPGNRPYIERITKERYYFNASYFNEPGEIFLTDEEKAKGVSGVLIEPNTKTEMGLSRNKAWPWERWQELVKKVPADWLQIGPAGSRRLEGVRFVETPTFRDALAHVYAAQAVVTTDGAIHHAAAALGRPAVVLWGGVASPELLGYKTQTNISHETEHCGSIQDCLHCRAAMNRIEVEEVADAVERLSLWGRETRHAIKSLSEGGGREAA